LLACCSVDFFVFMRNGHSFTTSLVYPWRRGRNYVEMVYKGVKEKLRTGNKDVQGQGREGERRMCWVATVLPNVLGSNSATQHSATQCIG